MGTCVLTQAESTTFGCVELGLCHRGEDPDEQEQNPGYNMDPVGGGCSLGVIYRDGRNLTSVFLYPAFIPAH